MIYICSKEKAVENYWENEFNNKLKIKAVEDQLYYLETKFVKDDLLILDISQFKDMDDIFDYFNQIPKNLKVVALVDEPKLAQGAYLIKKGFKSYLGKQTYKPIMQTAIKTVMDNNVWLYPELMNFIIKNISLNLEQTNTQNVLAKLSKKEQEVANLVAEGFSNKEISIKLDVQIVTVKKHIGNIFTKLSVKDRVSLAILINK